MTLLGLYDKYDEIIIAVTDLEPQLLSPKEIKNIFNKIFKHLPKYKIQLLKGSFKEETVFPFLSKIKFDVVVTGNKNTIKLLQKRKIRTEYIDRAEGVWNTGTFLREIARRENE